MEYIYMLLKKIRVFKELYSSNSLWNNAEKTMELIAAQLELMIFLGLVKFKLKKGVRELIKWGVCR